MEKVKMFVVGIAFVITCVICVGAFVAALGGAIDFLTFLGIFIDAGFDFSIAAMRTDIDIGEAMSRVLMGSLIFGVPIGLIGLIKAMHGDNPFRKENWGVS